MRLTKFAVYSSYQFVHDGAKILIFLYILTRWHGNLDQHDLAYPLRVLGEEDLERVQLLWHTLDIIETIDADNKLDPLELALQSVDAFDNLGLLKPFLELFGINTDGEGADSNHFALELDSVGGCSQL